MAGTGLLAPGTQKGGRLLALKPGSCGPKTKLTHHLERLGELTSADLDASQKHFVGWPGDKAWVPAPLDV